MWPFNKKEVKVPVRYKYDSVDFQGETGSVNSKVQKWLEEHSDIIPISISVSPAPITGCSFVIILYKYEVKNQ